VVGRVDTVRELGQAKTCAQRSIELDDTLSEAHAALSLAETFGEFNLAEALWQGERALELNPDSAVARYAYAMALCANGRPDEANEHASEGCAIDPLMAPINYCYGLTLYYQRRWNEAEAQLRRTLEISPQFHLARAMRGIALARSGQFSAGISQIHEVLSQDPALLWELVLAYVDALAGNHDEAEGILQHVEDAVLAERPYFAAGIYGALGDLDRGFAELEHARDLGFAVLATAAVDPVLDPFRADPRWQSFLRSVEELAQAVRELQ
jgi:tetratricopeptide (TPR) repeat protein